MTIVGAQDTVNIVRLLKSGAIGVMPTDTIYGIVAAANNEAAVTRLYKAKHRERKPGTVIAADPQQLIDLGIDADQLQQVAQYWPNALSVVLSDQPGLEYLDQGKQSLAVRVPAVADVHDLLAATGPLLTSSANQPGQPPAQNIAQAQAYFGSSVDFYVDGGQLPEALPSTVIRLTPEGTFEVLRQGAVQL